MRSKWIIISLSIIILLLIGIIIHLYDPAPSDGLLSPRVYAGILEPKSYLILDYDPLRTYLQDYILENNYNISVYVVNLRSGASFGINARESFSPASLNKVPLAILILKQVEEGSLSLDQLAGVFPADRNNASGSLYNTSQTQLPIRTLLIYMLRESDNTAYNVLSRYINNQDFNVLLWNYFGYYGTNTTQTGQVIKEDRFVNPHDIYNLFSSLYLSTVLSPENSEFILSQLSDSVLDIKQHAGLPEEVVIAHKFAIKDDQDPPQFHDCGIIYYKDMRTFYCVMTRGLPAQEGIDVAAQIVQRIYTYNTNVRAFFDQYKESSINPTSTK